MMKKLGERCLFLFFAMFPLVALAAEEAPPSPETPSLKVALAVASGIAIAIAAFGGAFAQGRAVTAAMEGISRNPEAQPRMFVLLILGLAFIESLVIYAFVISLMLQGKI